MDIFTAASRMGRAARIESDALSLGEHGVIGDGLTCALIGRNGAVDWMCMPRFDSPSVFGSLIDAERGGTFRVCPARQPYESVQAYDSDTNVLQTLFRNGSGAVLVVTDSMPWTDDPRSSLHELHRLIECRAGEMALEVVFDPRFDYARGETRLESGEHGLMALGPGGERLALSVGADIEFRTRRGGGRVGKLTVRAGQHLWLILSYRAPAPEPPAAYRPFEQLRSTRRFWRGWASQLRYDGPWRHEVLRSALVLKMLQYAPTGAMVAAPTTSLPEGPSGDRNWDYRYSWTRDSAMAIRAMNVIGYSAEARHFFHFVRDTIDARGGLDLMVALDGQDVPAEILLEHLSGHRGHGPVRIGNGARDQSQLDITGWLLDAAYLHERAGGVLSLRLWRQIRDLVDRAIECADEPDHGIWEPRVAPAHHVHTKLMTWVAFDRAARLAPLFGDARAERRWTRARQNLRREILERGYDETAGSFVSAYGEKSVDATLLLFPSYGFLAPNDPRVASTIDRIQAELRAGRFLRRYDAPDGIDAGEGAFVLCGFWLSEALALAGALDEAMDVFHAHVEAANHLGLLAEEVDPASGAPLGNFPQAFSHLGLIQAAARLNLALRQRDEGLDAPPRLPFDPPQLD